MMYLNPKTRHSACHDISLPVEEGTDLQEYPSVNCDLLNYFRCQAFPLAEAVMPAEKKEKSRFPSDKR